MPTNIQQLPLIQARITHADNEDLLASFAFMTAGTAAGYPLASNQGNATIGPVTTSAGAKIGDSKVQVASVMSGVATYLVFDPDGGVIGIGTSGVPFNQGGLSFTLSANTVAMQTGDAYTIVVLGKPLDLTGITFAMQVRTEATDAVVYADANTSNGQLLNGLTAGTLGIVIPQNVQPFKPGSYGFDILASGDNLDRRAVTGPLIVEAGYTKPSA